MQPIVLLVCLAITPLHAGTAQHTDSVPLTHADTLLGSITPQRAWWDVTFYDLHVTVDPSDSSIRGSNGITYRVVKPAREMQIDLMMPLQIDSVVQDRRRLTYRRDGRAFFITLAAPQPIGHVRTVTVYYHGAPRVAKQPPWKGGFAWDHDDLGHPWIVTACQYIGASVWWPNKDTWADEPDSQRIAITVPDSLVDVSNGRLRSTTRHPDGTTTYEWFVQDPINTYDVAVNISGAYAHFSERYAGEGGTLTLDFWPLASHLEVAKQHFQQVTSMLACYERWFGPYPWYRDGYKLVEVPYPGMEHQSAIAYGAQYRNGDAGWDYIIVHESAHEWFGNNVTAQDIADQWVHESFAAYAEGVYTECQSGPAAGAAHIISMRETVRNEQPIIAHYGVHQRTDDDMYSKGPNLLHTIRQVIHNDTTWRNILRGLNTTFWHRTVTGAQIQHYISTQAGIDFDPVFRQYLTTTQIPVLEYKLGDSTLSYRWTNVVPGFKMPVRVLVAPNRYGVISPTETWRTTTVHLQSPNDFRVDENYYVESKQVQ